MILSIMPTPLGTLLRSWSLLAYCQLDSECTTGDTYLLLFNFFNPSIKTIYTKYFKSYNTFRMGDGLGSWVLFLFPINKQVEMLFIIFSSSPSSKNSKGCILFSLHPVYPFSSMRQAEKDRLAQGHPARVLAKWGFDTRQPRSQEFQGATRGKCHCAFSPPARLRLPHPHGQQPFFPSVLHLGWDYTHWLAEQRGHLNVKVLPWSCVTGAV